jgi:hypothetical protein
MEIRGTSNCGVYDLHGVRNFDPDYSLSFFSELRRQFMYLQHEWTWPGVIVFSDAKTTRQRVRLTKGDKLAAFITENDLGTLTVQDWTKNPNTGNQIKVWMWVPNHQNLERFCL